MLCLRYLVTKKAARPQLHTAQNTPLHHRPKPRSRLLPITAQACDANFTESSRRPFRRETTAIVLFRHRHRHLCWVPSAAAILTWYFGTRPIRCFTIAHRSWPCHTPHGPSESQRTEPQSHSLHSPEQPPNQPHLTSQLKTITGPTPRFVLASISFPPVTP